MTDITPLDHALQAYREADHRQKQAAAERDAALETVLSLVPEAARYQRVAHTLIVKPGKPSLKVEVRS